MTLADAIHALAISGCRLAAGPDGGITLDVPPGATVARQVLDTLRAHRDQLATVVAPAPARARGDLAQYLEEKSITGTAAELVLHAARTFDVATDRITVEIEQQPQPEPAFFEPGIPCITTVDTEWNEPGRGLVTLPAGALALAIPQTWAIADADQRIGIDAAIASIRRQRKPLHVPVWLAGKARAIEANLITFDDVTAPAGMNLIPWRAIQPQEN